jgi:hypothetical protein
MWLSNWRYIDDIVLLKEACLALTVRMMATTISQAIQRFSNQSIDK